VNSEFLGTSAHSFPALKCTSSIVLIDFPKLDNETEKDVRFGRKDRLSVSSGDANLPYGCKEEHGSSRSTRWILC